MLTTRVKPFRAAAVSRSSRLCVVAKDSRIGRAPITVPKGVTVTLEGQLVRVKVRLVPHLQAVVGSLLSGQPFNYALWTCRAPTALWSRLCHPW